MNLKVEDKNKKYADILKEEINSSSGELELFLLFKAQYLNKYNVDTNFSNNLSNLSSEALLHFETLGKVIKLLGGNIDFNNFKIDQKFYENDLSKMIEIDIRKIKERIISYTNLLSTINDKYIKEIIEKYIIDYRNNLKILEMLQLKYKRMR